MEVLRLGQEVAQLSGGAFDVTVGPVVRLWRRAARRGVLPDPEGLEAARRRMGPDLLELDLEAGTARCTVPGMRLDLGGIAKGLALDKALGVLRQGGASAGLVDGGGDVAAFGAPPGAAGWTVALEELGPRAALTLADGAVATSGDRFQGWELEGLRRSHLVDPRTAEALVGARSAGVLATDGALADALASALCVLGVEKGLDLLERLPGVEGWVAEEGIRGGEPCLSSGMLRRMRVPPGADSTPSGRSPQPREP
jgi:thiamine biosynthesis lipoprotein